MTSFDSESRISIELRGRIHSPVDDSRQSKASKDQMASISAAVPAERGIPQKLLNFFARYPPKVYSAKLGRMPAPRPGARLKAYNKPIAVQATPNETSEVSIASNTSSADANAPSIEATVTEPELPSPPEPQYHNPFLPYRNPETGSWRGPAYSLRRQADLAKLAKQHGMEELLPPGRKSTAFKEQRLEEIGLRVKGTGEGHKVKGHKWERNLQEKLDKRKKAMEEMPALIKLWKEVCSVAQDIYYGCLRPSCFLAIYLFIDAN